MKTANADKTSCRSQAQSLQQQYEVTTVTDEEMDNTLLYYRSSLYSSVFGITSVGCDTTTATTLDVCLQSALVSANEADGTSRSQKMEIAFNALRQASEMWCSCWDTGASAADCEAEATAVYTVSGGQVGRWTDTDFKVAESLATSFCDGGLTTVDRSDTVVQHVSEFPVSCDRLNMKNVIRDIEQLIHNVDQAIVAGFRLASHADHSAKCEVTSNVDITWSILDRETLVSELAAILCVAGVPRLEYTAAGNTLCSSLSRVGFLHLCCLLWIK